MWAALGAVMVAALGLGGCTDTTAPPATDEDLAAGLYSTDGAPEADGADGMSDEGEGTTPSDGPSESSEASGGPSDLPDVSALPPFPTAAFQRPAEEWRVIDVGDELWRRECMAKQGFDYEMYPPPDRDYGFDGGRADNIAWFGRTDPAEVAELGYQVVSQGWMSVDTVNEASSKYMAERAKRSDEENTAHDACQEDPGPAFAEQGWRDDGVAAEEFGERRAAEVLEDPRVVEALTKWSTCVAAEGYTAGRPRELEDSVTAWRAGDRKDPATQKWGEPATEEEIAAAVVDAACQRSSNLWLTVYMAQVDVEEELLKEYRPTFEKSRAYDIRQLELYQEYIASVEE
jgi:hypothetical protein